MQIRGFVNSERHHCRHTTIPGLTTNLGASIRARIFSAETFLGSPGKIHIYNAIFAGLLGTYKMEKETADTKDKQSNKKETKRNITVKDTADTVGKKWKEIKDFFPRIYNELKL
ncbi:hypothetical protein J1N35_035137 [Gossypium stocksii]|uniref:Uncharacterized protein n=1 Tax=Gossypium stocksii TaxID=47602 RepID=A0A9D3UTD0_9ROSI|nr:hypothetical protein J1N35_035137 [Gossypium stocksii]